MREPLPASSQGGYLAATEICSQADQGPYDIYSAYQLQQKVNDQCFLKFRPQQDLPILFPRLQGL